MASPAKDRQWFEHFPERLKFLNEATLQQMLIFPEDMKANLQLLPNKLNNQVLVGYFEQEWDKYLEQ
jgi:spermidine synthase